MFVFGPVPSRRLGFSVGVNNIPPKICPYSCVYCQLGRTNNMQIKRQEFYNPEELAKEVKKKIEDTEKVGDKIDFITFVADGEPTIDINLEKEIDLLKQFNKKIAIISNASLICDNNVKKALMKADWVSLKVDGINDEVWKKIDRPNGALNHKKILEGIIEFSQMYKGFFVTETMLVKDINDSEEAVNEIANFLKKVNPKIAYISIPTRPPAEKWANYPEENIINRAYQIISSKVNKVECLIGYEGNEFSFTGDVKADLLSITAVHPMRLDAVKEFLQKANAQWNVIDELIKEDKMLKTKFNNEVFYSRKILK